MAKCQDGCTCGRHQPRTPEHLAALQRGAQAYRDAQTPEQRLENVRRLNAARRKCAPGCTCGRHYVRTPEHRAISRRVALGIPRPRGADNPEWQGDVVKYRGAHMRIERERGKARDHACVDCGEPAEQWSYDGGAPNERVGDGQAAGMTYSPSPAYYSPRCGECHKQYDSTTRQQARVAISQ